MKVGIVSAFRFHSFEAARELKARGLLGRLFTGISASAAGREGLEPGQSVSHPFWSALVMAGLRAGLAPRIQDQLHWMALDRIDRYASSRLDDCDVVMAFDCSGLWSGRRARQRGARLVIDRPVIHIESQNELLREAYAHAGVPYTPIHPRKIEKGVLEYKEADLILAPSQLVARSLTDRGLDGRKVAVLPLGADVSRFYPDGPRSEGLEICFAGNVTVQKGIYVLAEAVEKLAPFNPKVTVAGPVMAEGRGALARMEKAARLEVAGKVSPAELRRLMSRATAFVLPSLQDGFGMVASQAMACETPCIVSSMAGASEIIRSGENGMVFTSGSADSLADSIAWTAQNPDQAKRMAQNGREQVARLKGWGAYGDALAEALSRLSREPVPAATR